MSTASETATAPVPRPVQITKWVWIAGSALSVLGAAVAAAASPQPILLGALVATVIQAAIAVPAALALPRGRRWARRALLVLAALSIGSLYQTLKMGNISALLLNLALGMTLGLLQGPPVRTFFGLPVRGKGRNPARS